MKFYDREKELDTLRKNWEQSASQSMMTTMIGRRRIGKTALLLKSVQGQTYLYLYVSKDNEQLLCSKFQMVPMFQRFQANSANLTEVCLSRSSSPLVLATSLAATEA